MNVYEPFSGYCSYQKHQCNSIMISRHGFRIKFNFWFQALKIFTLILSWVVAGGRVRSLPEMQSAYSKSSWHSFTPLKLGLVSLFYVISTLWGYFMPKTHL